MNNELRDAIVKVLGGHDYEPFCAMWKHRAKARGRA